MWTRNFKNLISTLAFCANLGGNGSSHNAFGDSYPFNYKAPSGTVYEIATKSSQASTSGTHTYTPFIARGNSTTNNTFESYSGLVTDQNVVSGNSSTYASYQNIAKLRVGLGSGNTAETEDDYCLNAIIDTVSLNSAKATPSLNADGTITIEYQVVVTASADVTVSEIGLFACIAYGISGSNDYRSTFALLNRIVLDEPVSIASGDVGNITFSITTPRITIS